MEAEDRPALVRFNEDVFGVRQKANTAKADRWIYEHIMLVDGNDDRGIDVGIFAKDGYAIESIQSHVDDPGTKREPVFSRDCAEYTLSTPGGNRLLVLVNHFKSKGFGAQATSTARRRAQAARVAEIYEHRRAEGIKNIIVLGDFNDTPDSAALKRLVQDTDLRDVSTLGSPTFDDGGRTGTFGTGKDKIDYILCSPVILGMVTKAGIFRKGVWRGPKVKNPWPMYDTITRARQLRGLDAQAGSCAQMTSTVQRYCTSW